MKTRSNIIPPMLHPYAVHWEQPPVEEILIDDTHALMTEATFKQLHDYSCSRPTGAYEGKMWRCHVGAHDSSWRREDCYWILCWFGLSDDPAMVSNNSRRILLA